MSKAKCIVWDLDNTVWCGTLLEGDEPCLREGIRDILQGADAAGIVHAIASRNERAPVEAVLERLGIAEFFVASRIGWGPKSESILEIAAQLGFAHDTILFVDDDPYERAEVAATVVGVKCLAIEDLESLIGRLRSESDRSTPESRARRRLYLAEQRRSLAEESFKGTSQAFLQSLQMVLTVNPAESEDLVRVEELTRRTSQLNSTGRLYSLEELERLRCQADHLLLVASLEDRFGSYGRIGIALVHTTTQVWTVRLLLTSCRVIARGIGGALLAYLINRTRLSGSRLQADFIPTERNRIMLVTYRLAGLRTVETRETLQRLEDDPQRIAQFPAYIRLIDGVPAPAAGVPGIA